MRGKKAFELTATFLVILILTIVIFTGAIYFTKRFFTTAEQMRGTIDKQTQAEIEALLYQQGSIVALPTFRKTVSRGKQTTFGLGVRNILEETKNFYVVVSFSKAFTPDEEIITGPDSPYIDSKWLLYHQGPYSIPNNKLEMIPILVNADLEMADALTTEKGIYSFNICVLVGQPLGFDCANPPRPLPPHVYGDKIYKMYVEVV